MICPVCRGRGKVPLVTIRDPETRELIATHERPCEECGGCGVTSCCESNFRQPEPEDNRAPPAKGPPAARRAEEPT
jgi:hypothetical protein